MARITVPQPDIDLYNDGFAKHDLLDRSRIGKNLTNLVDSVDEPLVIALDGAWGSGKSFFLKCWVGAHQNELGGQARTIYFDAFQSDYLEEPLVSLVSAIETHLPTDKKTNTSVAKLKKAATYLWRPLSRISLALATSGVSEVAGSLGDAVAAATSDEIEKQLELVWSRAAGQQHAMSQFHEALSQLSGPDGSKIVIVIDELDRCRPDYALQLLEILKHFFSVPNVHFVLGVNMKELENSVRARYGIQTDASRYLQKSISVSMTLPQRDFRGHEKAQISRKYFLAMAPKMGLKEKVISDVNFYLKLMQTSVEISLRDVDKILSYCTLIPQNQVVVERLFPGYRMTICGLVLMRVLAPSEFDKALNGNLRLVDALRAFSITDQSIAEGSHPVKAIREIWATFLDPGRVDKDFDLRGVFDGFGVRDPSTFQGIVDDYMGTISFDIAEQR